MAKQGRKWLIAFSRKRLKSKSTKLNKAIQKTTPDESKDENNNKSKKEAWMLIEFAIVEDPHSEDIPICISEDYILSILYAHERIA